MSAIDLKAIRGRVLTVCGPIAPEAMGAVAMHEHLYGDTFDWDRQEMIVEERPLTAERHDYMMREAIPVIRQYNDYGCHAFVDASVMPWRAWPDFYVEAARAANVHIILCTGFYRELELGTYWARKPDWQVWTPLRQWSVEQMTEFCIREVVEGLHGSDVHCGAVKLGTSRPEMTEVEAKCFRAGARAQRATGVHITTHCTHNDAAWTQLEMLDREGVDLNRVAIGHVGWSLGDPEFRTRAIEWMKRGASFLATNLGIVNGGVDPDGSMQRLELVDGLRRVCDAGLGDRVGLGMDGGWGTSGKGPFGPLAYVPPPQMVHLFTHTLPHFRRLGLTAAEEDAIMRAMSKRIVPVQ